VEIKNHILFITAWYPDKFKPLNGNYVKRHALAVSELCDVSVLYVCPDAGLKKECITEFTQEPNFSECIIYYPAFNSNFLLLQKVMRIFRYFRYMFLGMNYIKNNKSKPDIIHANILTRTAVFAWFYKISNHISYIITEHWTGYLPQNNAFKGFCNKIMTRYVVKKAEAVTTVSPQLMLAMKNHGLKNKNYKIVYNIIDTDIFVPREKKDDLTSKKIITHITNFKNYHKNTSGILDTIKKLSETRQDFVLKIIGSGNDKEYFEKYAQNIGLSSEFVSFEGQKNGIELVNIINSAAFMLMFSNFETFQIPVIESLSCGVPVITTQCGGILDGSGEVFGKVIEPANEDELLKTLNSMLDKYDTFDPQKLRNYAIENFSKQKVALDFFNLYQEILHK
jgi:glycosyltransferase involved in cell wall biosynthesis